MLRRLVIATVLPFFLAGWATVDLSGQDTDSKDQTTTLELAGGAITMQAPESWKSIDPRFNMIEAEFAAPKKGDDQKDARLTIMAAGGSVDANIQRWEGQFSNPDGSAVDSSVKEMDIDGLDTHMVDISGTYADRAGGPTSPPVMRDDYRMLAAIIETGNNGTYFIKFYGGADTIDANAAAFEKFVKSLKVTQH